MITLKSAHEIELMRRAGKITAAARALAGEMVKPGVTTHEIDKAVYRFIKSQGAEPSFLNYSGYPASVCVSVNDEIIHGIPGPRVLKEGDIVSVDVGAYIGGFHGDCAATYPCGKISAEAQRLIDVTQQSFFEGIRFAREGQRLSDISAAVQKYVEDNGYSVVREYVGHGIGRKMHAELRRAGPRSETAARHDDRSRTHGERGWRGSPGHAGRLDCQDPRRFACRTLRKHDPHHQRRSGASDASRDLRTCGWTLRRATLF